MPDERPPAPGAPNQPPPPPSTAGYYAYGPGPGPMSGPPPGFGFPPGPPTPPKQKAPVVAVIGVAALVFLAVVVGAVTFIGQASDDDDVAINRAPTSGPERDRTATTTPADEAQTDRIIGVARGGFPEELGDLSDEELIGLARRPCERFADGATAREVLFLTAAGADSPQQAEAFGVVAGMGVTHFCPQHTRELGMAALELADPSGN